MLNLLTKTKPWMAASLLVASTVFGQNVAACQQAPCTPKCQPKPCPPPCPQPCPPTQLCAQDPCCPAWPTPVLNAAYNYPARTQVRCPWDFYADASFLYWQPVQENMELGFVNNVQDAATFIMNGKYITQDFSYRPGFKLGVGMNYDHDNWDSSLRYTWFHGTHNKSANQGPSVNIIMPLRGHPEVFDDSAAGYSSASQKWKLKMDFLDLDLGRWGYVGTKLTCRPAVAVRGAWIRQTLSTNYVANADVVGGTAGTAAISERTSSWAVGPRLSMDTNWMLGEGFRLIGNGAADLLYTRYTKLSESSTFTSNAGVLATEVNAKQSKTGYLRPHAELEFGFGWGTYLDCNNWYMDFAATYGFQAFWNQNMFRNYTNANGPVSATAVSNVPNGDLFVHGLNVTFRLDF